ncbi:hypothetical protein EBF15_13795 [Listeria monocytogenes]|uniref:Uncharacterized protein n=1 Tax=Listeria monocytogenes TaxID=1639 RepID=A0A823J5H7_LISMN|nr:hypothetical protein [Listeria monocytogenes]EAG9223072.1 hypothetical protein [Listeria monocytogenes]EAG9354877.1 hypothetical protein [Listeria monocytogenes]MDU58475.1 hypothetical protein [Listeria monocytogenes]
MYNQKCNEMSDSCRERLKMSLIYIYSYTICVISLFQSQKSAHFSLLFTVYTNLFIFVTKSTYSLKTCLVFYMKFTYLSY